MITKLQNLISKGGKLVIFPLLLVVIIAFVLYLAQGTSVFDFFPDPSYEKEEFYGVDLNDPDQMRVLNVQNRIASDLGAIVPPLADAMVNADEQFLNSLRGQLQAAFQGDQANIDRSAVQQLFGFIQSWPTLPKDFKVREIARSGMYESVFSQASIRAMLVMDGIARSWKYLSDEDNHIGINNGFHKYVSSLAPSLQTEENRTKVLNFVGLRQGVSSRYVEYSLFQHFRASQVDGIFSNGGYTLSKEAELDMFKDRFGWKADILKLNASDSNSLNPQLFKILIRDQPKLNDSIKVSYGSIESRILFVQKVPDINSSDFQVQIGSDLSSTLKNLLEIFEDNSFEFETDIVNGELVISPITSKLPGSFPEFTPSTESIEVVDILSGRLKSFHDDNNQAPKFIEPSRTFATMVSFPSENFISIPPEPSESRIRSYFDLNRDQFDRPPVAPEPNGFSTEGAEGPKGENVSSQDLEKNASKLDRVDFEEVREEIRLRIIEEDRADAERDARDLAKEASLQFLEKINGIRDRLRNRYSNFTKKRNSIELGTLIAESGGVERKISFSSKEMGLQTSILGLERRESERRSNREPLEEVSSLTENLFFTRSIRATRDGFSVFLLDAKTSERPGLYEEASFADLYGEYVKELNLDAFSELADSILSKLQDGKIKSPLSKLGRALLIDGKNVSSLEISFNRKGQLLTSKLNRLESEREVISKAERDENSTAQQIERKLEIDGLIEDMRDEQDEHNKNRALSLQLAEACPNLELGAGWVELERSGESVVFARLNDVYSLIDKQLDVIDIEARENEIEITSAGRARDLVLGNLLFEEFVRAD